MEWLPLFSFLEEEEWEWDIFYSRFFLMYIYLFIIGTCIGALANYLADRLGWTPKFRSPWRRLPAEAAPLLPRRFIDYIPVLGWLSLRRWNDLLFPPATLFEPKRDRRRASENAARQKQLETVRLLAKNPVPGLESRWFWLRPFLVECGLGIFLAWLYCWQVDLDRMSLTQLGFGFDMQDILVRFLPLTTAGQSWIYAVYVFLFVLLLTSSLLDLDDYFIPDSLTILGTFGGLVLLTLIPMAVFTPFLWFAPTEDGILEPMTDVVRYFGLIGSESLLARYFPLIVMLFCWLFWCFAVLDRRWYTKYGTKKALALFVHRLRRSPVTRVILILCPIGIAGICWIYFANPSWQLTPPLPPDESSLETIPDTVTVWNCQLSPRSALFNALVGMVVGMVLIWSVRIVGHWALGVEAMGFGDVMLMATIGTFISWQGSLVAFFLAPFAGLVFGVIRLLCGMQKEIPYGPFLCLGTVVWLVCRTTFWNMFEPFMKDPILVLMVMVPCLILLGVLLKLWRMIRKLIFGF